MGEISAVRKDDAGRELEPNSVYMMSPLRRPRLAGADEAARRHARPDGQALGRDHRDADRVELQGRPDRARVLQLDPRRPQGPRRHRAQDRELGLPHPPPRRRGAGLHRQDGRLRHRPLDHRAAGDLGRRGRGLARRAHPRPRRGGGRARPEDRRGDLPAQRPDRRARRRPDRGGGRARDADPLAAHLRGRGRHLRPVLRARPRPRHQGEPRRGGRHHRRPVDRRARHAADDADLPHRRHRPGRVAVVPRGEPGGRRCSSAAPTC